jgi:hypothetical protein
MGEISPLRKSIVPTLSKWGLNFVIFCLIFNYFKVNYYKLGMFPHQSSIEGGLELFSSHLQITSGHTGWLQLYRDTKQKAQRH